MFIASLFLSSFFVHCHQKMSAHMARTSMAVTAARRRLGQSQSNVWVRNAAMRIAAAFRRLEGLPLDVTYEEIQGDNLEEHLERYVKWMATTPIPAYGFKEDLSPLNPENNKRLKVRTLVNYLGQYKEFLKEQFPQTMISRIWRMTMTQSGGRRC